MLGEIAWSRDAAREASSGVARVRMKEEMVSEDILRESLRFLLSMSSTSVFWVVGPGVLAAWFWGTVVLPVFFKGGAGGLLLQLALDFFDFFPIAKDVEGFGAAGGGQ